MDIFHRNRIRLSVCPDGLEEAGGTCVLHISSVPFEQVGYVMNTPKTPMVASVEPAMKAIPAVMLGLTFLLGASYRLRNRTREHGDAPAAHE